MYRILFDPDEERVATKLALWMGDVCEKVRKGEILLFTDLSQGARSLSQNRRSRR